MIRFRRVAVVASVAASLALAPSAIASGGGLNSGGVNAGGLTSGGGGGGGGGTTAPAACISSFSNSTGYYSVWAAIWTSWSVSTSSCPGATGWQMTYLNNNTGTVDFVRSGLLSGATGGTVDEDWAAFSTPYTVTLQVTDSAGNVMASTSALVTTKAGKTPGA